jgi:subtilisin family serine protease
MSGSRLVPMLFEAYPEAAPAALGSARLAGGRRAVSLPQQSDRLDSQLLPAFQSAPDRRADFLIYMRDQADLSQAYQIKDWAERGRYVYQALVGQAERSQHDLRGQLAARGLRYQPLWIVNALLIHGDQADAQALAARADVAMVRANRVAEVPQSAREDPPGADRCNPAQPNTSICWNVHQIGADRVWSDFGVTGKGITLANIDTGVRYDHPALITQYRGTLGNGRFDHNHNWYDPQGTLTAPSDLNGHGTHTMGTMVGRGNGTPGQPSVGIAPGSAWIAAEGCSSYSCTEADLIAAAQWMLAPTNLDGSQPRPDLRPMIINNSWAGSGGSNWYAGYTAAWRAAGIFPVFAAGNAGGGVGQVCGSIESPGDYADVVAVGATDQNDTLAGFSLLGPAADGRRKPDFMAPGTYAGAGLGILSTYLGDGTSYQILRGTSMAAPHVAGLVALLWSANPALIGDYDATYALIRNSARILSDTRCGDPAGAPNNVYGYGRIDAYAAVARARVDVPWLRVAAPQPIAAGATGGVDVTVDARLVPGPGTYNARLQMYGSDLTQPPTTVQIAMTVTPASQQVTITGRVVSADTGAPIAATVGVKGGLGVPTDSNGSYTLILAAGAYEIVASAPAFLPETLKVLLSANQQVPDIVMQPDQPRIGVATAVLTSSVAIGKRRVISFPISNTGSRPLYYHVRVLPDQFAMARSDQPAGPIYKWVDLPANAPTLKLDDNGYKDNVPLGMSFPFYNYTMTETLVTTDGMLAFSIPTQQYSGPLSHCFPASEFHFYTIAPFRTDLDPSRGGAIRYGTVDGGTTFVLSYEKIPLHNGPANATYTFQLLLHPDGRIIFQYGQLAALPLDLSAGVQQSPNVFQQIGCGSTTPIGQQLAIELQPQVNTSQWLRAPVAEGQVPAVSQQTITATLDWVRPGMNDFEYGRIEITSNDPIRSRLMVPVQVDMLPAPHEIWLWISSGP